MNLALNLQSSKKFTIGVQISEKSGWEQGKKGGAGGSLSAQERYIDRCRALRLTYICLCYIIMFMLYN